MTQNWWFICLISQPRLLFSMFYLQAFKQTMNLVKQKSKFVSYILRTMYRMYSTLIIRCAPYNAGDDHKLPAWLTKEEQWRGLSQQIIYFALHFFRLGLSPDDYAWDNIFWFCTDIIQYFINQWYNQAAFKSVA